MRRLIIGVGNEFQGDDAIGRHVARKLHGMISPDITVREESGDAAELIDAWIGADYVIIIDAMVSGTSPGSILRFDASDIPLPREIFPHFSTHSYSVAESIELARTLEKLPKKVVVYGIEGKAFQTGSDLSPEIRAAGDQLVRRINRELGIAHIIHRDS